MDLSVGRFFKRLKVLLGATILLATPVLARAQAPAAPAPLEAKAREPKARVALAPYRYGDLIWENDRTAHRIYGHPLEAAQPPSSSGIDAWGKSVRWPFMERRLQGAANYHEDSGEGVDFYGVHGTRGAGGLGIWHDNKLWTSRNFRAHRILKTDGDVAQFEVDYAPWPVDVGRKVWETRRFTLPMGSNFTRMVSTIHSDKKTPLVVGIGLSKYPTALTPATLKVDRERGTVSFWTPTDPKNGAMGIALLVDPASIVEVRDDYDNILVLLKQTPGKPFVYYTGATWSKGQDFRSQAEWEAHVAGQRGDFDPAHE